MANNPYGQYSYFSQPPVLNGYQQPSFYQQQPVAQSGGGGGKGIGSAIGGAAGALVQLPFGIIQAHKANKDRKKFEKMSEAELNASPEYQESEFAKQELAQSQAAANSSNPAILAYQNQLQQQAANVAAAGQKNAMSGAEAINAAIAGQQVASSQLPQIAQMQTQFNQQNRGMLSDAMRNMTAERQNVFNDRVRRNDNRLNFRLGQLKGANDRFQGGMQNVVSGVSALGSAAGSVASGGM